MHTSNFTVTTITVAMAIIGRFWGEISGMDTIGWHTIESWYWLTLTRANSVEHQPSLNIVTQCNLTRADTLGESMCALFESKEFRTMKNNRSKKVIEAIAVVDQKYFLFYCAISVHCLMSTSCLLPKGHWSNKSYGRHKYPATTATKTSKRQPSGAPWLSWLKSRDLALSPTKGHFLISFPLIFCYSITVLSK